MWYVRRAEPADLDALTVLVGRCLPVGWGREQLAPALAGSGSRALLAVDAESDALLGFLLARRIADLLEIDLVGVDPAARRQGLGRALLAKVLAEETADGSREARLELASENQAALGLYQQQGFVVVGRRSRYYPDGDAALLLSRLAESP